MFLVKNNVQELAIVIIIINSNGASAFITVGFSPYNAIILNVVSKDIVISI